MTEKMNFVSVKYKKECPITAVVGLKQISIDKRIGANNIIFEYFNGSTIIWDFFDNDDDCADAFEHVKKLLTEGEIKEKHESLGRNI